MQIWWGRLNRVGRLNFWRSFAATFWNFLYNLTPLEHYSSLASSAICLPSITSAPELETKEFQSLHKAVWRWYLLSLHCVMWIWNSIVLRSDLWDYYCDAWRWSDLSTCNSNCPAQIIRTASGRWFRNKSTSLLRNTSESGSWLFSSVQMVLWNSLLHNEVMKL